MPSQLQQHHDNGVRDDIITNSIMENTMSNIKNIHNNRQILCDPQSQQHHNESYSKFEDESMMIVEVDHKKNNDNVKINKSNEINNRNEGTIMNCKSNTFDNSHLQSSSKNLSSFSRKKSSVLNIESLLCESSANLPAYDSPSSVDEDSSMDDVSSHLGDTESLGSPRPFHKNSSTPVTTPPRSPSTAITTEKRLFNNSENNKNDTAFVNDHSPYFNNNSNEHQRHQQHHSNYQDSGRYVEQGRFQEDTPWKRSRTMINNDLVLPPIRSFSDLRSESNNNDFSNNNEISNGQFVHNPSSPDHGKINSPVDRHSSQKTRNQLEQLADITESLRTSSSNFSHADPTVRLPSLTVHNRSFENDHRNFAPNNSLTSPRKSSFDVVQTRFSPYTPPTLYAPPRLPSNLDQRCHSDLSGFMSTTSRNDHENPYLHGHHNSSYGYDRGYMQQRPTYGGMHSPSSPNTYSHHGYSIPSHSYPTPPPTHPHLQLSHNHHHLGYMDPTISGTMVKAKRKRANANQLKVLNQVFQHTFFPSTELRIQLGKQLGMSPRTVQIWFQNKRQSWRSKSRATNSPIKDDDGDSNLEVEVNNNNNDDVNENLVSRRSSNSNLSCSDDDETGRRSIPDSPLENSYSRSDYFTRSQMDNNSNENVNMTSGGKIASTQNSYFAQQPQHSSNNNGDYYHHRRTNSSGTLHPNNSGVLTPTSPSSSLTNQLPSPVYPSTSTNERLPTFASSFAHASSYHHAASPTSRLPMINHRSPQQSSFGYQSTVSSGI